MIARTVAASILFLAAGAKGWTAFLSAGQGDRGRVLSAGQIVSELLLAAWLISGISVQLVHRLAIGLFGVFSIYTGWLVFGGVSSCGCFGEVRVSPWLALALDFGVLAGLVGFPPPPAAGRIRGWPLVRAGLVGAGITAAIAGGFVLASAWPQTLAGDTFRSRKEVLDPDAWVGKTFPLLPHLSMEADLSSGDWIVVLHRHGCTACRAIHKEYEDLGIELGGRSDGKRVAFVEVPWSGEGSTSPLRRSDLYVAASECCSSPS